MALPVFDEDEYLRLRRQGRNITQDELNARGNVYANAVDQIGRRSGVLDARGRLLDASAGTIQARFGVGMAQRAYNAAQGSVIDANQASLGATRGYIGLQQALLAAENADRGLIRSARDNVADKVAVAEATQERAVSNRMYDRLGVSRPIDVDVPAGQSIDAASGARPSLRTQEQIVRGEVADRQEDRQATLRGAQLAVQLQETNVTEAEIAARRVGLTLAEANQRVRDAENVAALADLDVDRAGLDVARGDLEGDRLGLDVTRQQILGAQNKFDLAALVADAEDQGYELYTDPVTRERSFLSPAEADERQYLYELGLTRQRLPQQAELSAAREQITRERREQEQRQEAAKNAMVYFDDSDFVEFLLTGSSDPDPYERNVVQMVREGLRMKFPGIPEQALEVKLKQYVDAARRERAKRADEAGVAAPARRR